MNKYDILELAIKKEIKNAIYDNIENCEGEDYIDLTDSQLDKLINIVSVNIINNEYIWDNFNNAIMQEISNNINKVRESDNMDKKEMINEEEYIIFLLGKEMLFGLMPEENDLAYEFCKKVRQDFLNSKYDSKDKSLYECLESYCNDNFKVIDDYVFYKDKFLRKRED